MSFQRRTFLQLAAAAALAAPRPFVDHQEKSDTPLVDQVPPMLDHLLLGCNDLQSGIDFVERHTGVRAVFGGVHPGRGTHNALLSLGTLRYLEIIAPDPQQSGAALIAEDRDLRKLTEPRLVAWAAHPGDIQALAAKLRGDSVATQGPTPGSRKRPDGRVLNWSTLALQNDAHGLLPFFIQWATDSVHPSEDAPTGCQLLRFELLTTDPAALTRLTSRLGLDVPIAKAAAPQLHAVISSPKSQLDLTS